MVELGLYGVARIYWSAFSGGIPAADFRRLLVALGIITALLGAVMCTIQRHLKRLLAYSTICHTGLFTIALATLDHDGITGAVLYALGHAAIKGALFLLVGLLLNAFGSVDEIDLFDRGRGARLIGTTFVLASLALAGLPPFGVGLGKAVSEEAAGHLSLWLPVVFVIGSAVTGGAALRASLRVFFGVGSRPSGTAEAEASSGEEKPEEPTSLQRPEIAMLIPIYGLLSISLVIGLWPGIRSGASDAAGRLVDHAGYLAAVFHARPGGGATTIVEGWTVSGVLLGLLSAGLALALALVATHGPQLSRRKFIASAGEWVRTVVRPLHRLHSGHLGDYVAWLIVGVAGVGGLLGLHP
jgi:multicomponent Na+:H+ antiporter subunit D